MGVGRQPATRSREKAPTFAAHPLDSFQEARDAFGFAGEQFDELPAVLVHICVSGHLEIRQAEAIERVEALQCDPIEDPEMLQHPVQPTTRPGAVEGMERNFESETSASELVGESSRHCVVFDHQRAMPLPGEVGGRTEPGQPGPDDDHVSTFHQSTRCSNEPRLPGPPGGSSEAVSGRDRRRRPVTRSASFSTGSIDTNAMPEIGYGKRIAMRASTPT